jgi:hydroxymethylpyrimidine/phosphomethylpyrimidine kinase
MKTALTIAGSDSSGGAGIQADIKTITAHKMYAMSVITALTAQNTTGVFGVFETPSEFVEAQIKACFDDIVPNAVKIGMVSNKEIIKSIAKMLKFYNAKNIVVDPVMVATSGSRLMKDDAVDTLRRELLPLATVITPNIPEAEVLAGFTIADQADMERAAAKIAAGLGGAVLVKGGHLTDSADDLLWTEGRAVWFSSPRVDNPNTHGTGCTLSSAIACNLAKGRSVEESVRRAKAYITGALKAGLDLGKGSGPLDHAWATPEIDFE